MAPDDHLIAFAKRAMHFQSHRSCPARISLILAEPKIMSANHSRLLWLSADRFFRVFTYDPQLLARLLLLLLFISFYLVAYRQIACTFACDKQLMTYEKTSKFEGLEIQAQNECRSKRTHKHTHTYSLSLSLSDRKMLGRGSGFLKNHCPKSTR